MISLTNTESEVHSGVDISKPIEGEIALSPINFGMTPVARSDRRMRIGSWRKRNC